jgi:hypothetical protein
LVGRESIRFLGTSGFGIALRLALPELPAWGTSCVAVVGGRAEGLLFLVVADEAEFDED